MEQPDRLVVGAAIVRDGHLLAARRTTPPETAGRWELPGGKVDDGETPDEALVREIEEELGCRVEVVGWLPGEQVVRRGLVLRIGHARLVAGDPSRREHDALRWLGGDALDDVDWLDPDRPFLPALRALLRRRVTQDGAVRGIFHEESTARLVAGRLRRDGWTSAVAREAFAGEDDDEDHAWAVTTDAPEAALDLLVETYDGWLEHDLPVTTRTPPMVLPAAPRRTLGPES